MSFVCRGCKQTVRLTPESLAVSGGIGLVVGLGVAAVAWVVTGAYSKSYFFIVMGIAGLTVIAFGRLIVVKKE